MSGELARFARFFQFRLRTLFVLLGVIALWLGWQVRQAERQQRAVAAIVAAGGVVEYDFESAGTNWWRPAWIRRLMGDDFLHDVVAVRFDGARLMVEERRYDRPTDERFVAALARLADLPGLERLELGIMLPLQDEDLKHIADLSHLRALIIYALQITDTGLEQLSALRQLQFLNVDYTSVTEEGVERLRRALPECRIEW
jgi:hypothetical protein